MVLLPRGNGRGGQLMNYTENLGAVDVCVDCMLRAEDNPRAMTPNLLTADWDTETGDGFTEFSKWRCDWCYSPLAGNRFRYAVWGN